MKQLASLFLALLTLTATAQINYPFNPDENADAFISTPDLMEFLVVFGYEWEQEEIQVDSIPLSMYLSSLEAMIEASALPAGTMPGQFLQWNGETWSLVMPKVGCTLAEACNFDPTAHVLFEDVCILQDECGVCDGPGAIYDCGCSDIPEGDCDCEGNVVDALGACGGTCAADEDGDGICDDGDSCVGEADECGVCNGPGAIYGCGCSDIPEGACDCDGNVFDECGVCGGVGLQEGWCDCSGAVLDAVGICGGACNIDIDGDGICDDDSIAGCTNEFACNFDPSASIEDGSCDYVTCFGCSDPAACNFSSIVTNDTGSCLYPGCTNELACNFDVTAGCDDGLCLFPGCTDETACNFDVTAGCDDGSCEFPDSFCNDVAACNYSGEAPATCGSEYCFYPGCDDPVALNFDEEVCGGGECIYAGCTAINACNYSTSATVDDGSCDFSCAGCTDPQNCFYNPFATSSDPLSCETSLPFSYSIGSGPIPEAVSWSLKDSDGVVVLSGGAPASGVVYLQSGEYTIEGWNAESSTSWGTSWTLSNQFGVLVSLSLSPGQYGPNGAYYDGVYNYRVFSICD